MRPHETEAYSDNAANPDGHLCIPELHHTISMPSYVGISPKKSIGDTMPRDGSSVYSKPTGTTAVASATIESAKYNSVIDDLVTDANTARPVVAGGTGATSASAARTSLGVPATADVQAVNANLTSLSGLTLAADRGLYSTGANTLALYTLAAQGRTFLSASTTSAQRIALGLGTAATVDVIDEDDMVSDSATRPPSQQSIKAYVDASVVTQNETAERSITLLATDTFTHGNGSTPSTYDIYAICKTADSPYVVDEVIRVPDATQVGASEYGVTLSADATNFRIRVGAQIPMHTDAGAAKNMTVANWRFIVKWRA